MHIIPYIWAFYIGYSLTSFLICVSLNIAGIINSIGDLWKDQRRFLHDKLRQFGMTYMGNGKHMMEMRIMVSFVFFM